MGDAILEKGLVLAGRSLAPVPLLLMLVALHLSNSSGVKKPAARDQLCTGPEKAGGYMRSRCTAMLVILLVCRLLLMTQSLR